MSEPDLGALMPGRATSGPSQKRGGNCIKRCKFHNFGGVFFPSPDPYVARNPLYASQILS
jgi:hypothetical protein